MCFERCTSFLFSADCLQFSKQTSPPKHILAFPTKGLKCIVFELKALEKWKIEVGHPVQDHNCPLSKGKCYRQIVMKWYMYVSDSLNSNMAEKLSV